MLARVIAEGDGLVITGGDLSGLSEAYAPFKPRKKKK